MRCSWPCRDMGSANMQWPCTYRIGVKGVLASSWPGRTGGMENTIEWREDGEPVTVLQGSLMDEAALSGVLETLYELHLPLLSVEAVETREVGDRGH